MKLLFRLLLLLAIVSTCHAVLSIRTRVWAKKTDSDKAGATVEMQTRILESGNNQIQNAVETAELPENTIFPDLGELIADQTFTGSKLPKTMMVRVLEKDAPINKSDGVCNIKVTAKFSRMPIEIQCTSEKTLGSGSAWIINVQVQQV